MSASPDRLYELLPAIYRQRDAEHGFALKAFLRVLSEQIDVVEDDVAQLYENWFIETAEDWVVPYLGDLIGYRRVAEAGPPGDPATPAGRRLNRALIPRREVANTVRYRRRKGTAALLEELGRDVAGWPSRVVEFCGLLVQTPAIRLSPTPAVGGAVDLRDGDALDLLDGPFDRLAHSVDVRRIVSHRTLGRHNIPSVGLYAWRLESFPVTRTPAYCLEEVGPHCFTFSVLGNDAPLGNQPVPETDPTTIAGELNLPTAIRRRRLETDLADYYGPGKSFAIWDRSPAGGGAAPIAPDRLVVADLSGWHYRPLPGETAADPGQVAIDPVLGRIAFPPSRLPREGVWVSYHYRFPAEVGGGEYARPLAPAAGNVYRVGSGEDDHETINLALKAWREDEPEEAIIELTESAVYTEQLNIRLRRGQSLELRAADRTRPVIRLLDWQTGRPDSLLVQVEEDEDEEGTDGYGRDPETEPEDGGCPQGARFALDGLLITGRGVMARGQLTELRIRHSTLVPGWSIDADCCPRRPNEPSLELYDTPARVEIERSIVGTIQVHLDEVRTDPIEIVVAESVLDATDPGLEVLGAPGCPHAHTRVTIGGSTVIGRLETHTLTLAENSIFLGRVEVGRRQVGCVRFCYVPPGSRTPRRYRCQPDGVSEGLDGAALRQAELRVLPRFNAVRYGQPAYCQLAADTAEEIVRGADDRSEMGVYHHLYQPQRSANLRARLAEYTPAGMEAGLIHVT